MSLEDQDGVQIPIRVGPADTAGVDQAKRAIGDLGDTASQAGKKTAEGAKEGAEGLKGLGRDGLETAHVMHGLEEASQGGVRGFVGLARAANGFFGLMRTALAGNPFGWVLIGLGTLAGLAAAFFKVSESADKTAEGITKTGDAAEQVKKHFEDLEKAAVAGIKRHLDAIEQLKNAYAELDQRISDNAKHDTEIFALQKKLELARLPEGDKAGRAAVEAKYDSLTTDASVADALLRSQLTTDKNEDAQRQRREAERQVEDQKNNLAAAQAELDTRKKNAANLKIEHASMPVTSFGKSSEEKADGQVSLAQQEVDHLKSQLAATLEEYKKVEEAASRIASEAARDASNVGRAKEKAGLEGDVQLQEHVNSFFNDTDFKERQAATKRAAARPTETKAEIEAAQRDRKALAAGVAGYDSEIAALRDKDRLTFAPGGDPKARAEIENLTRVADETRAALKAKDDIIVSSYKAIQKDARKTAEQLANNRQ